MPTHTTKKLFSKITFFKNHLKASARTTASAHKDGKVTKARLKLSVGVSSRLLGCAFMRETRSHWSRMIHKLKILLSFYLQPTFIFFFAQKNTWGYLGLLCWAICYFSDRNIILKKQTRLFCTFFLFYSAIRPQFFIFKEV